MAVIVCPADRVQAPVELVWELLMHPAGYGRFWDLTVERVEPEGPAVADRRRGSGGGPRAAPDPVPHVLPARDGRRQPDRLHPDRRTELRAPLRVRLLLAARVAGLALGAARPPVPRRSCGLAAAAEASGRGASPAGGGRQAGQPGLVGIRTVPLRLTASGGNHAESLGP